MPRLATESPEVAERDSSVESKGERTRSAILDCAVRQFALLGARSASVPAIAREIGVSPSAVYSYFATKDDLFAAAVDDDVAGLITQALPEVASGRFDGDFESIFVRLLAALDDHPLARRVLEGAEARATERLAVLPAEIRLQRGVAAALRAGQRRGSVRGDIDCDLFAAGLEAVVIALLMSLVQMDGHVDSQHARGAIAVLHAAISPST